MLHGVRSAAIAVLLITVATLVVTAAPASAGVNASGSQTFPSVSTVGTQIATSVTMSNTNTPPHQADSNTLTSFRWAPSCRVATVGNTLCSAPDVDSGVFTPAAPGQGRVGTGCAGVTFTPSAADSNGVITYTPSATVVLEPPGGAPGSNTCTVDVNWFVAKAPIDAAGATPGLQTHSNVGITMSSQPSGLLPSVHPSVMVTVNRAQLSVGAAQVSRPVMALGGSVTDSVTFAGGSTPTPTGTVTFQVFGPNDPTCAGPVRFTGTTPFAPTTTSSPFHPTVVGTHRFTATYSGDANYLPLDLVCGDDSHGPQSTVVKPPAAVADFDGDGDSDVAVFRPSNNVWYVNGQPAIGYGAVGDQPVPADYDGDGDVDAAVFRPLTGVWYINGQAAVGYGVLGDVPVPADYDHDGDADIAVFRPSDNVWYIRGQVAVGYGAPGDVPVPGDYNGDRDTDIAVFRPSNGVWYIRGQAAVGYGESGDLPRPADYDGDGDTDIAVFRPSNSVWYIRGQAAVGYGEAGDKPLPADYDGDGDADVAVFRPSTNVWYILGQAPIGYGQTGDVPVPTRPV